MTEHPAVTSRTHLVIIPSYNTGPALLETLIEVRRAWSPVWLVIDGSTDGSANAAERLAQDEEFRVLRLPRNGGKGAAVFSGIQEAAKLGFTHALTIDADGQHPADHIPRFMAASVSSPGSLVLGNPLFGPEAPVARVKGRRLSNSLAHLQTGSPAIADCLFGMRVYPIADLLAVMASRRTMRGFDFDPEAAVRLCWRGLPCINLATPVRYRRSEDGGVSHFRYGRDNWLLTRMHVRLLAGRLGQKLQGSLRFTNTRR